MARMTRRRQDSTTEVVALLNQSKATSGERPNERRTEEQLVKRPVGRPLKRRKTTKDMTPGAENEEGSVPHLTYSLEASPFDAVPSRKDVDTDSSTSPSRQTRSKLRIANRSKQQAPSTQANVQIRTLRNLPSRRPVTDLVGDESPQLPAGKRYNLRNQVLDATSIGYPTPEGSSRPKVPRATSAKAVAPAPAQKEHTASKKAGKLGRKVVDQQSTDGAGQDGVEDDEESQEDKGDEEEESESDHNKVAEKGEEQTKTGVEAPILRQKTKVEIAMELHGCLPLWQKARKDALRIRKSSRPVEEPVQKLTTNMKYFDDFFQQVSTTTPGGKGEAAAEVDDADDEDDEEDSLSELESLDLDKIISATMEPVKKDSTSLGENDQADFRHEICRQVIPRAVRFSRQVLVERAANGRLSTSALEELCKILTATQVLCKAMLDLSSAFERLLKGIKLSSLKIEKKYRAVISKRRTEKHNALARLREKELADSRARELEERRRQRPADRQNRVNCIWQGMANRQRHATTHAVLYEQEPTPRRPVESEVYDVDDLGLPETTPPPTYVFHRAPTEDIPGPPKRLWRIEETLALSFLLLQYRDVDRYERIHEKIGQFSRHIRQAGGENILSMTEGDIVKVDLAGDTLDELGNMDVAEIEEHANYLKAMQAGSLEMPLRNGGQRDNWASLAGV